MNHTDVAESDLQATCREGRAILVAGTGVSIAASFDAATKESHRQASWAGLLENGLEWLKEHRLLDAEEADAHLLLLRKNPQTHRFISAAEDIIAGMGGTQSVHFKDWLAQTIGTVNAHDRSVIDALDAVRQHGHLLATTNYDGLLLGDPAQLTPITWQDTDALIGTVRHWVTDNVIFLHGYWRQPESVILDWKSYERIARDEQYRENLAAFWKTNTWVYVGCGVNGLADPDFGLLLERYAERARQAGHWDYCLVRSSQRDEFQSHFDRNKLNIHAISFGKDHGDLPQYLRSLLPPSVPTSSPTTVVATAASPIPIPPTFYAEPDYIGSHSFVGRQAELDALSDWANRSDPTNLLLLEAIGGNGKSMLTWEWTTKHATSARSDWAGRFWYSFYERGAIMADFCQRALAYMTGRPLKGFEKRKTAEMKDEVIALLHARPWLFVLDGLERVLVAYHRIDAAEVSDEEAKNPTDKVLHRNPCDAIRDEDSDLLRALAACTPSKVLVSSRLTPRVLLNQAGQPIPGARRITLLGLRPPDAEALLRSCHITGDSTAIQDYLQQNCDNHPLVVAILAGLIANYLPDRGNFDAWSTDPSGGVALDLAQLDLIQRRNHILLATIAALPHTGRQLLSTLAFLSESIDFKTLEAFNPHLPSEPEEVNEPMPPEKWLLWEKRTDEQKTKQWEQYELTLVRRKEYEKALKAWRESVEVRSAPQKLAETVRDLQERGLLQYDDRARRYDLHPVVRAVAAGNMNVEDKQRYGLRVVDHFSSQQHNPYEQAQTLQQLSSGLHVARILLKLGHFRRAADACSNDLMFALSTNLEAYSEALSLMRPFFSANWDTLLPSGLSQFQAGRIADLAGMALLNTGGYNEALAVHGDRLLKDVRHSNWNGVRICLANLSDVFAALNQPSRQERVDLLALELATVCNNHIGIFNSRLHRFRQLSRVGNRRDAEAMWSLLDPMGRAWSRANYRPGEAEFSFSLFRFWQGNLEEADLVRAADAAERGNNHVEIRRVHELRGAWRLYEGEWALAAASLQEAVRTARERSLVVGESETGLALAKFHLGQLTRYHARSEAERLAQLRQPANRYLAMLWLAMDDPDQAKHYALAAYRWAWADGEPYVQRYELIRTTELLQQMNVPIPTLQPYDPAKDEPFPWEADVRAAIEELRAEKEAKKATEAEANVE